MRLLPSLDPASVETRTRPGRPLLIRLDEANTCLVIPRTPDAAPVLGALARAAFDQFTRADIRSADADWWHLVSDGALQAREALSPTYRLHL